MYNISPEYFDAARTTLLAGRQISWHDDKNAPRVAVVNREFAQQNLWFRHQRDGPLFQDAEMEPAYKWWAS